MQVKALINHVVVTGRPAHVVEEIDGVKRYFTICETDENRVHDPIAYAKKILEEDQGEKSC